MKAKGKRSCAQVVLWIAGGLTGLCLLLAGISALVNQGLPRQSPVIDRLSEGDKARLAETYHLRQSLGSEVLPGWDQAQIPVLIFNETNVFLVGMQDPPDGWLTVPGGRQVGGAWERVPDDLYQGQPYYRQQLAEGVSPQNFTSLVGDSYTANLMTLDWFRISLADQFRNDLPGPIKPVFPYSIAVNLFMPGGDRWGTALLHEAAHAYQGLRAAERLAAAERAGNRGGEIYPFEDEDLKEDWQAELDLLNEALRAKTGEETRDLAEKFVAQRAARRSRASLPPDLVDYERQREWVEGIGKYAELTSYRLAATTPGYEPAGAVADDPDFHEYKSYQQFWDNEVNQIRLSAGADGDGRFYYSGMAQAVLLDRLSPGWKAHLFEDGVFLEDLLAQALQ